MAGLFVEGAPGTAYYVDATGGSDGNEGTSESEAWQTIAKVNAASFVPGNSIFFKRGETWSGTALVPPSSGVAGHPITFGAYGDGAKPIIDGNDTVNCISITGDYLAFENIRVIDGLDFGFYCQGSASYITMTGCEADGCGNDNVIFIDGAHHCTVDDLVSTNPYDRAGAGISCLEVADGSHDITISDATLTGSPKYGVQILAHATEEFPYNVTIEDCQISSNTIHGVYLHMNLNSTLPASPEVIIQDCTIEDNVNAGLVIAVIGGGATYPAGVIVRRNVIQDNYADGSDYSVTIRGADHYLGYNLIAATQIRGMIWNDTSNLEAEHNTLYVPSGAGFQAMLAITGTLSGLVAKNNIWSTDVTTVIVIVDTVGVVPANSDMDYNLHYTPSGAGANRWNWNGGGNSTYANWLTNSGQDANSPTPADPLFTDAANDDFTLQAGSPARGAGEGGVDCGAYPYVG
jgi:hypothetical protein